MGTGFFPSEEEVDLVAQIYDRAGISHPGVIDGQAAADLFAASTDLPPVVLGTVWDIADKEKAGHLSERGVAIAIRLIGWAQSGEELSAGLVNIPGPLPRMKGISEVKSGVKSTPSSPIVTSKLAPFTEDDRNAFQKVFEACVPTYGLLEGDAARDAFMTFGLSSTDDLWKIWEIADTHKRGALDRCDFALGMYLIQALQLGHLSGVPSTVPEGTYDAIVASFKTYVSAPSSPVVRKPSKPKKPVRKPPSAPVPKVPVPPPVSSPEKPIHSPPEISGADDWAVSPDEKATADRHFDTLDPQNRGFVDEDVAAQFMLGFELTPEDLAYIWDLADLSKDNRLTRDGFAIALHLIQHRLAGSELPHKLPPSLTPPSLRTKPPDTQIQRKRASTVGPAKTARAEVRRSLSGAAIPIKPPQPRLSTKPSLRPSSSYGPLEHESSTASSSKSLFEEVPPLPAKPSPYITRRSSLRPTSSYVPSGQSSLSSSTPTLEVPPVPVTPSLRVSSKPSLRPNSSYIPSDRKAHAGSPPKTPFDDAPFLPAKPSSPHPSPKAHLRTQYSDTSLEHEASASSSPKTPFDEVRTRLNVPTLPAKPPTPYIDDINSSTNHTNAVKRPHRTLSTTARPTVGAEQLRNLKQENLALTSKIEELAAQVDAQRGIAGTNARLIQENKALLAKMQEMEQITSQLLQANEAVHPMAEDLTRENQQLMRRIANLELVQTRLDDASRRLDISVQENKALSARLREVREAGEAASLRSLEEVDALKRKIEQLEQDNEDLRKRAQDMERTISQTQAPNATTNAREMEILMADVTRENEGLKLRLRQMQRSTATLLLSTSNGHAEQDELRRENQRLSAQVQELEQLTRQLQTSSEDNELQRVLRDVTHENEALKSSLRQVRQQVAHLQSSSRSQVEPLQREIVDLKAEIRRLQVEHHTSGSSRPQDDPSAPPPAYED